MKSDTGETAQAAPEPFEPYFRGTDGVFRRRDLTLAEKCMLCLISGLTQKHGYCDATNNYLAKRLGIEKAYAAEVVYTLRDRLFLHVELLNEQGGKRHIYLVENMPTENVVPSAENSPPHDPLRSEPDPPSGHTRMGGQVIAGGGSGQNPVPPPAPPGPILNSSLQNEMKEEMKSEFPTSRAALPPAQGAEGEGIQEDVHSFPLEEKSEEKSEEEKFQEKFRAKLKDKPSEAVEEAWRRLEPGARGDLLAKAEADFHALPGCGPVPARAVEGRAKTLLLGQLRSATFQGGSAPGHAAA